MVCVCVCDLKSVRMRNTYVYISANKKWQTNKAKRGDAKKMKHGGSVEVTGGRSLEPNNISRSFLTLPTPTAGKFPNGGRKRRNNKTGHYNGMVWTISHSEARDCRHTHTTH